ncbi:hypothetical protein AOLI_G00183210 [Acnodon oligacanthus]
MFDLPGKSLDALFDACLLENETQEPNEINEVLVTSDLEREEGQAQVEEVSSAMNLIKKTAKELIKPLESSFNVGVSVMFLYKCLVEHLMEELETLSQIKITHQILGGRLFSVENEATSYIANEAYKSLLNKHLMKGASCVNQWTMSHIAILKVFVDHALGCVEVSSSRDTAYTAEETLQDLEIPEVQEDSELSKVQIRKKTLYMPGKVC